MPKKKRGANRTMGSDTSLILQEALQTNGEVSCENWETAHNNGEEQEEFHAAESLRVQKAEWVRRQIEEQHQNDAKAWERLVEEQKALSERNLSIEEDMNRNRHLQRYQQECVEDLKAQVYALHGISEDKLEGMREYKNARYQGFAVAVFVLSIMLAAVSGYFIGVLSEVTLFMLGCIGVEGALLSQEGRRGRFLDGICRFLYAIPFPAMLAVFVCYVMDLPYYESIIYCGAIAAAVILVIGTSSYFWHNPYRAEKKRMRAARADLKELEQSAAKAVRINQKLRLKEEKKSAEAAKKQAKKQERLQKRQEASLHRKENWNTFKQNTSAKWKSFVNGIKQKSEARKIEKARIKAENAKAQMQQLQAQAAAVVPAAIVPAVPVATPQTEVVISPEVSGASPQADVVATPAASEVVKEAVKETVVTPETSGVIEEAAAEAEETIVTQAEEDKEDVYASVSEPVTATIISINGEKRKQQA